MRTSMLILRNTNVDAGDQWHLEGFGDERLVAKDGAAAVAKAIDMLGSNGKIVLQVIEFPNMDGSDFGLLCQHRALSTG